MRLDAFDYSLPAELIAQEPLAERGDSRLMVVDRASGACRSTRFRNLPEYLVQGDVLVVNRSRVIRARLFAQRPSGGRVELLVLRVTGERQMVALANPLKRMRQGERLRIEDGDAVCSVGCREGDRAVGLTVEPPYTASQLMECFGHVPLPPYIHRDDQAGDRVRYQTVFADADGSVAAPTAGLHFDEALIEAIRQKGVEICRVTLHVGLGTFLPLASDDIEQNVLHSERFEVDVDTLAAVRRARSEGRRVIAVGTTTTRVLESVWRENGSSEAGGPVRGETDLFIYPGFRFRAVDGLITNFHLPRSSLLLLVCAFLGTDHTLACYREAVQERYRFFSYGDAMFIR